MSLVKSFELIWRRNLRVLDLQMSCKGLIDSMTEYQNSSPNIIEWGSRMHVTRQPLLLTLDILRLSITRYYKQNNSHNDTTSTTRCIHERHPISRVMGCRSWNLQRNMTAIYRERIVLGLLFWMQPYVDKTVFILRRGPVLVLMLSGALIVRVHVLTRTLYEVEEVFPWGAISVIFFFLCVNFTRWCSIAWNRVLIRL